MRAFISNTDVASDGQVKVDAHSKQDVDALVAAGSVAIAGGGTTGFGVSVAGVYTLNFVAVATQAYITDTPSGGDISVGSIDVGALDESTIDVLAGAASVAAGMAGTTGVAVSIGFAMAQNKIRTMSPPISRI